MVVDAVITIPLLVLIPPEPPEEALLFTLTAPEAPPIVLLLEVTEPVEVIDIPAKVALPAVLLVLLASANIESADELPMLLQLIRAHLQPAMRMPYTAADVPADPALL